MNGIRRVLGQAISVSALVIAVLPHTLQAQRENRLVLGVGIGRFAQLEPLASPAAGEFKLEGVGASVFAVDYWFMRFLGGRVSYAWLRTNLEEPDLPSSARMQMGSTALLLSPVQVARGVRPYAVLGGAIRRYDVNARLVTGTESWDIAPRQYRPAAVAGGGVTVRIGRLQLAPEATVLMNTFRNEAGCRGCVERDRQKDLLVTLQIQLR